MTDEKRKRVDLELECYNRFFDFEWARDFITKSEGTVYSGAAFNLSFAWRAVDNTHFMPYLMIDCITKALHALENNESPLTMKIINGVRSCLVDALSSNSSPGKSDRLNYRQSKRLASEFDRLQKAFRATLKETSQMSTKAKTWNDMTKINEFNICLWGSQRLCFAAIYYAYEDFLTDCVRIKLGIPSFEKRSHKEFVKSIREAFGESVVDECYLHTHISTARNVRDALLHNGGRLTASLNKMKQELSTHGFLIENDEVQITATRTHALFNRLAYSATTLLEAALLPNCETETAASH